jgi:7-carboxy-7-deazaguanine synthase
MHHTATISEVFSSRQGEGLYVGEPMTFVRFASCSLRCRYCDTPQGLCVREECRVEFPKHSGQFTNLKNPVSATKLCEILAGFDDPMLAITGGEPLEQSAFLAEWLPAVAPHKRVLLETNGVHHEALALVAPHVHVISMDLKLPSSSGCRPLWDRHEAFLRAAVASGREVYTKIVVTADTTDRDLECAISIVARINKYIPIVLQPATPTLTFHGAVSEQRLGSVQRLVGAYLEDVRTIPQMHKQWGIL